MVFHLVDGKTGALGLDIDFLDKLEKFDKKYAVSYCYNNSFLSYNLIFQILK